MSSQSAGINVDDFVIRPELLETTGYNSNSLGSPNSGSSELESQASLGINSDWTRDAVGMSFNLDNQRFFAVPSASYTNWTAGVGGSVSLGNDVATFAYSHLALNLAATDLGVADIVTPAPYTVEDVRASYLKLFARFSVTPSFEFEHFVFGQSNGVTPINYDALNHNTELETVTGRYEVSPGDAGVVIVRTSEAQYQTMSANNYIDVAGFVGLDLRGDSVIQYRVLFGVENRSFLKNTTASHSTPTFEVDAIWLPTQLDTVIATATRRLDEPTSPFADDQEITDERVEYDHELRANVFVTAYAEVAESQLQSSILGFGNDSQTQLNLGLSARWNINQNLSSTLSYAHNNSVAGGNSTSAGVIASGYPSFTSNIILLGINVFE